MKTSNALKALSTRDRVILLSVIVGCIVLFSVTGGSKSDPPTTLAARSTSTTVSDVSRDSQVCSDFIDGAQVPHLEKANLLAAAFAALGGSPIPASEQAQVTAANNALLKLAVTARDSTSLSPQLKSLVTSAHQHASDWQVTYDSSTSSTGLLRFIVDINAIWAWCSTNVSGTPPTTTSTLPAGIPWVAYGNPQSSNSVTVSVQAPILVTAAQGQQFGLPSGRTYLLDTTVRNDRSVELNSGLDYYFSALTTDGETPNASVASQSTCASLLASKKGVLFGFGNPMLVVPPNSTISICLEIDVSKGNSIKYVTYQGYEDLDQKLGWSVGG